MKSIVSELLQSLDSVKSSDEVDQIVEQIAEIGEPALGDLLAYSKLLYSKPGRYLTIMRIIQKIGYPANSAAIPFMIDHASDINSNGWEVAMTTLIEIGDPVIPEVRDALLFYSRNLDEYHDAIQGLATFLKLMGSPTIDPLLPELLYLLEAGTDENYVDEYALWPLRKIGSPKADVALVQIGKIISSKRSRHIRKAAIEALMDFDHSATRFLLPVIKECLADDEEIIRKSAKEVLNKLGEL